MERRGGEGTGRGAPLYRFEVQSFRPTALLFTWKRCREQLSKALFTMCCFLPVADRAGERAPSTQDTSEYIVSLRQNNPEQ